jgi:hypothetical protein
MFYSYNEVSLHNEVKREKIMRPTRPNSVKPPRRPTGSTEGSGSRTAETKNVPPRAMPPTEPVIRRQETSTGVVVIRRKGKVAPFPVPEEVRAQPHKARFGGRKFHAKKTPPPPPPRALYRIIMEQWPMVFPARPDEVRPLAVGIHEQLEKQFPDRPVEQVRRAIAQWRYPRLGAYLRVVARGGPRFDLDGNPSGEVSASEQENARERLKEWRERRKAQIAAAAAAAAVAAPVDGETPEPLPLPPVADDL